VNKKYRGYRDLIGYQLSFDLVKKDFDVNDWRIMGQVLTIRCSWHYTLNPFQSFILKRISPLAIKFKGMINIKIPVDIKKHITPEFLAQIFF